ncbi:hypothetical protein [Helicobacter mustelae]|nr:hypothetical protein [Helicobacter mustelae]
MQGVKKFALILGFWQELLLFGYNLEVCILQANRRIFITTEILDLLGLA